MHHALPLQDVLSISCNIYHHRIVLRQTRLEVGLLPFELFLLGSEGREAFNCWLALLLVGSTGEAEELQMKVFDEIKVAI